MSEKERNIATKISDELNRRFPGLKPIIAELTDDKFIYELEKHGNFTYYQVRYHLSSSGTLTIDWENAELAVF